MTNKLHLVYDLMETNVAKLLKFKASDFMAEGNIKLILYEVLKGLKGLHDGGFVHCNIKPSHIFIEPDTGKAILGDLSQSIEKHRSDKKLDIGSDFYKAPEILLGSPDYDEKCDIFSIGLTFSHMLLGRPLISGEWEHQLNEMWALFGTPKEDVWPEAYDLSLEKDYRFPIQHKSGPNKTVDPVNLSKTFNKTSPEALDLIYKMCIMHPKFRANVDECLKHPYFENLTMNEEDPKMSPSYFMNNDYYHPSHDPRKFYRQKFDRPAKISEWVLRIYTFYIFLSYILIDMVKI